MSLERKHCSWDVERFSTFAPSKATLGQRYELFKKQKGPVGNQFFSTRVSNL